MIARPRASLGIPVLVTGLAAAAVALWLGPASALAPLAAPLELPWWALALGFCAAESFLANLYLRRDAHTVSLGELPLVLGLFFASPGALLAGQLVGDGVALLAGRQRPVKVAFNLATFSLGTVLALVVFRALAPEDDPTSTAGLLAALAGALAATLTTSLAVHAVVGLAHEPVGLRGLVRGTGFGCAVTAANTALALLGVVVLWRDPGAAWLLAVPAGALLLAYRASTRLHHEREQLVSLHETSRLMRGAPEVESALLALLERAREVFHAEAAAVSLLPEQDAARALRTVIGAHGRREVMARTRLETTVEPWRELLSSSSATLVTERADLSALAEHLGLDAELGDAMVARMAGETRALGILVVATRRGDLSPYDGASLLAFQTLADQASASLEMGRLEQDLDQLVAAEARLRHQAFHDALTGLPNRALFEDRVAHAVERTRRTGAAVAVLLLDLDGFKQVNDSVGHQAGDELLVEAGRRIAGCLRDGDTPARIGGDEFAVLLEDLEGHDQALAVADRIRAELPRPFVLCGRAFSVEASVGVAFGGGGGAGGGEDDAGLRAESTQGLLRHADLAMYDAKDAGGGRVSLFRAELHRAADARRELADDLRTAVARGELELHYQPVISVRDGRLAGLEALVRWRHPRHGLLAPAAFIAIAEESGAVVELGRWVLEEACARVSAWRREGLSRVPVSVNVSGVQLRDPAFAADVDAVLRRTRLAPADLALEITESILLERDEPVAEVLHELKAVGVTIALDDFGTGFSSLSYLARFPIDVIKLDRSFLSDVDRSPAQARLVSGVIALGASLGMRVVAEGVERASQLAGLATLEADLAQGFYTGPPEAEGDAGRRFRPTAGARTPA